MKKEFEDIYEQLEHVIDKKKKHAEHLNRIDEINRSNSGDDADNDKEFLCNTLKEFIYKEMEVINNELNEIRNQLIRIRNVLSGKVDDIKQLKEETPFKKIEMYGADNGDKAIDIFLKEIKEIDKTITIIWTHYFNPKLNSDDGLR